MLVWKDWQNNPTPEGDRAFLQGPCRMQSVPDQALYRDTWFGGRNWGGFSKCRRIDKYRVPELEGSLGEKKHPNFLF